MTDAPPSKLGNAHCIVILVEVAEFRLGIPIFVGTLAATKLSDDFGPSPALFTALTDIE